MALPRKTTKTQLRATIGIKEVQIIQWFVEPEARVEQFDKLCEVQSDKAATEVCEPCYLLLGREC